MQNATTFYQLMQEKKTEEAKPYYLKLQKMNFIQPNAKQLFEVASLMYLYETKKITRQFEYDKMCQLVDYPNITKATKLSLGELIVIYQIAKIEVDIHKTQARDFMYTLLNKPDSVFVVQSQKETMVDLYQMISLFLYAGEYEQALVLTTKGVTFSRWYYVASKYAYLLFYKAWALHELNRTEESEEVARECIYFLLSFNNIHLFNRIRYFLTQRIGKDPISLISENKMIDRIQEWEKEAKDEYK